jgi:hypothetical protein
METYRRNPAGWGAAGALDDNADPSLAHERTAPQARI